MRRSPAPVLSRTIFPVGDTHTSEQHLSPFTVLSSTDSEFFQREYNLAVQNSKKFCGWVEVGGLPEHGLHPDLLIHLSPTLGVAQPRELESRGQGGGWEVGNQGWRYTGPSSKVSKATGQSSLAHETGDHNSVLLSHKAGSQRTVDTLLPVFSRCQLHHCGERCVGWLFLEALMSTTCDWRLSLWVHIVVHPGNQMMIG